METQVGAKKLIVVDTRNEIDFPVLVLYPASEPSSIINLGAFSAEATWDTPVRTGRFPAVVISHGTGGNHLGYLGFAQHLADQGFIVAMPEHHRNNRNDNTLEGTMENLEYRPRHISLLIDALSIDPQLCNSISEEKVAIIGHSMGGYTALAAAGGEPWSESRKKVTVLADSRVKSIVLLSPATDWYTPPESLKRVSIPVMMLTAEHDPFTPASNHKRVLAQIPHATQREISNAGHFSFLSPFPASMTNPGFPPSTDPPGFDRTAFHLALKNELTVFLKDTLQG